MTEYQQVSAEIDAILAKCTALQNQREDAVAREQMARKEAMECAAAIGAIKGQRYIDLKRRKAQLAGRG